MKIRTGRLKEGEVVGAYHIKIWTAAGWVLNNKCLSQVLEDKAYEFAGVVKGPKYSHATYSHGGGYPADQKHKEWSFEVTIKKMKWEEVTE